MDIKQALQILKQYQAWRTGDDIEMPHTALITEAIEIAMRNLESLVELQDIPAEECFKC